MARNRATVSYNEVSYSAGPGDYSSMVGQWPHDHTILFASHWCCMLGQRMGLVGLRPFANAQKYSYDRKSTCTWACRWCKYAISIGAIIRITNRLIWIPHVFHDDQSYLEIFVFSAIGRRLLSAACRTRKRSTTRLKQLITTSQECPGCGQYTGGEGFPTSRPAKAKHPQVHLSGPNGFCYIESERVVPSQSFFKHFRHDA